MKRAAVCLAMFCLVAGCSNTVTDGTIHHLVFCWLKEPGNAAHRKSIRDVSLTFSEIPGVLDVRVGEGLPSDRPIVDDSYDVAIAVTFASEEDMNGYLKHPVHEAARTGVLLPLVERIVVYDFQESRSDGG